MATNSEPIFLVGAERSGTTLLRLMLDGHRELAWANEFEFAVDRVPVTEGWPTLDAYRDFLSTHRVFRAAEYTIDPSLAYPDLVRSFLAQCAQRAGKPRVGATVHRHFDRLLRIWPRARFIHIIRDPRDVARSCIGMGWAGNVWTGVERWIDAEAVWEKLCTSLPSERRCEVRYEALITQPADELHRLCDYMGLTFEAEMLNYAERTTYSAPDPSRIEQWPRTLTPYEIRLVEARVGARLQQRGYAESDLPALDVTAAMQARLRLQDRWARIRHAVRLYGWPLWLAEMISRRLGIRSVERRAKLRMNAVAQANLK